MSGPAAVVVGAGPAGLTALVALHAGRDRRDLLREGRPARAGCGPTARRCRAPTARCTSTPAASAPQLAVVPDAVRLAGLPLARAHRRVLRALRRRDAGVGDRIRYGAAVERRGAGRVRRLGRAGRGRLRGGVRRAGGGQRAQLGAAAARSRPTRARSTGARCTRTTTARRRSSPAGACWWSGWATRRWTSRWSPPPSPTRTLPLHPPRHADRAQVRVRQAGRPGHLAHDGAAAVAGAPAAHPPPAAPGRRQARDLRAARARRRASCATTPRSPTPCSPGSPTGRSG